MYNLLPVEIFWAVPFRFWHPLGAGDQIDTQIPLHWTVALWGTAKVQGAV